LGIVICGSGVGISIAANKVIKVRSYKVKGIRCGLCHDYFTA
jgi:ribose 5-phosphate isomerase RpiB